MSLKRFLLTLMAFLPSFLTAQDVDASWNVNNGSWESNGNWLYHPPSPSTFPDQSGATARFDNGALSGTCTLTTTNIIGHLEFNAGNTLIADNGFENGLNFQVPTGSATLNVTGGTNSFSCPLILTSPLIITNSSGSPANWAGGNNFLQFSGSQNLTLAEGEIEVTWIDFGAGPYTGVAEINGTFVIGVDTQVIEFGGIQGNGAFQSTSPFGYDINVNGAQNTTFSGSIQDFSSVVRRGTGTLTLTGTNSMETLSLQSGKVSIGTMANLGTNTVNMNGGTLQFRENLDSTISINMGGNITSGISTDPGITVTIPGNIEVVFNSPILEKLGGGTLILSSSTIEPPLIVTEGTLSITGVSSATTTVNGGTLKGTGTLQNVTVAAGGTIRGGNSIGTLNISGDLTHRGVTQVEISPSAASLIQVTGLTTILGASVDVVQQVGTYADSGEYTFLTSAGGVDGVFQSTVTGGSPGFSFSLDYSVPDTVRLLYTFNGGVIPPSGLTGQASAFARYLDRDAPFSQATMIIGALPEDQREQALLSASPSRNAFAPFAIQNTMFGLSDLVSGHLADHRLYQEQRKTNPNIASLIDAGTAFTADSSGRMVLPRRDNTNSFWVGVMGEYAHQNELDQNPSFHFWSGGSVLGWDFYSDRNLLGIAGGAAYTHLSQASSAGHANINYYVASLYDTLYGPCDFPLYIEFAAWGAYKQIHNYRHISFPGVDVTASATFHSWELVPHFGVGYFFGNYGFTFSPFAQFDLVADWQEGFQEQGAGAFNMNHQSQLSQFLRSEAGFRFYKIKTSKSGSVVVMIKGSYVNKKTFNTGSVSAAIVGADGFFGVETFRNTQNLGSAGLELLWRWDRCHPVTLSLSYNGEFGSAYWSQEGMLRLSVEF